MELRRGLTASLALRIFWLMALLIEIVEFSHICASFSVATDGHGYPLLVCPLAFPYQIPLTFRTRIGNDPGGCSFANEFDSVG